MWSVFLFTRVSCLLVIVLSQVHGILFYSENFSDAFLRRGVSERGDFVDTVSSGVSNTRGAPVSTRACNGGSRSNIAASPGTYRMDYIL